MALPYYMLYAQSEMPLITAETLVWLLGRQHSCKLFGKFLHVSKMATVEKKVGLSHGGGNSLFSISAPQIPPKGQYSWCGLSGISGKATYAGSLY